jgi:tryptophan synthase alpha chain
MNRIANAFKNKKAFIAFITGGDPDIETTEKLIIEMAKSGVDLIEIGIPFSDPVAEGTVIQEADKRALANGCTADMLFDMLKNVRSKVEIPILFMSYVNPIFVYGSEKFMQKCAECGIDGVIVPDLPYEEKDELSGVCRKHNIAQISLIAPTSGDRIEMIAKESEGFIYCVSSLGVTGVRGEINTDISDMMNRVRKVSDTPCAVGFGVSTPEQAKILTKVSDGVIIGSAIVRIIGEYGRDCIEPVSQYVREIAVSLKT